MTTVSASNPAASVPLAATTTVSGAGTTAEKRLGKGKKPGLKRGQKIRAARKLKPAQIEAIARDVRERAIETPDSPYTYAELAGKHGVSTVTLRGKDSIKAAMNETRSAAAAAKQVMEQACSEAAATKEELSKASQREEKKQLKQENANLRRIYQRLAMHYRAQGKSMPQVLAEFEAQMKDEAATNIVAPIFRS